MGEIKRQGEGGDALEVVIVSYGSQALVCGCLAALEQYAPTGRPMVIHLVDNSEDDSVTRAVRARFPATRVHAMGYNAGFAAANNVVLAHVRSPYALLLNPDTLVGPGVLDQALVAIEEDPSIGVLGCRLVTSEGTFDHAAKRRMPGPVDALRYFVPSIAGRQPSAYTAPEVEEFGRGDVDAVNGAFMLVRTEALRDVGLLDSRFWMYGEDLDWCLRFRASGWRVVYDGRTTITHLKGATADRHRSPTLIWHFHRSMAMCYRRHLAGRNILIDASVYLAMTARFLFLVTRALAQQTAGGRRR